MEWQNEHAPDCPVTDGRVGLAGQLERDPENAALLGAVPEWDAGGDEEAEHCACGPWYVDDLQSVEPEALEPAEGITVKIAPELDGQGFERVAVHGPTREAVLKYVRSQWGDEDPAWFADYVEARLKRERQETVTEEAHKSAIEDLLGDLARMIGPEETAAYVERVAERMRDELAEATP